MGHKTGTKIKTKSPCGHNHSTSLVGRAEKYFRGILSKQNLDVLAQCTIGMDPPEQQ